MRNGSAFTTEFISTYKQCDAMKRCGNFQTTWKRVFSSQLLPASVPVKKILEGPAVPSVSNIKASDRFVALWESRGIRQLIPNFGFSQMPYDFYSISFKAR